MVRLCVALLVALLATPGASVRPSQSECKSAKDPGDEAMASCNKRLAEAKQTHPETFKSVALEDVRCVETSKFRFSQREVDWKMATESFDSTASDGTLVGIEVVIQAMAKHGWDMTKDPPTAVKDEATGTYNTFDNRRVFAAILAGLKAIPCVAVSKTTPVKMDLPSAMRYGVRFCRPTKCGESWPLTQPLCLPEGLPGKENALYVPIEDIPAKFPTTQGDVLAFRSFGASSMTGGGIPLLRNANELNQLQREFFQEKFDQLGIEEWESPRATPWWTPKGRKDLTNSSVMVKDAHSGECAEGVVIGCWQWYKKEYVKSVWQKCKFVSARSPESPEDAQRLKLLIDNSICPPLSHPVMEWYKLAPATVDLEADEKCGSNPLSRNPTS